MTTATPIEHVIVIIGENRTFDHLYATYQPRNHERVNNLLSEGIVNEDGTPGPNFAKAKRYQATVTGTFSIAPSRKTPYAKLPPAMTDGAPSKASDSNPPPFATDAAVGEVEGQIQDGLRPADYHLLTTGASGLPSSSIDTRIANAASPANGPFPISSATLPYNSYTASPVHRFYQMWQQTDCAVSHISAHNPSGCLNDLFPWVETTIGAGNNGNAQPAGFNDHTTGEGSTSMGFYNMAHGDVPYLKELSDKYSFSDNFHQSIEGGTGANHIALGTGLAIYYTDGQGNVATPPANQIENPESAGRHQQLLDAGRLFRRQLQQLLRPEPAGRRAGAEVSEGAAEPSGLQVPAGCVLHPEQLQPRLSRRRHREHIHVHHSALAGAHDRRHAQRAWHLLALLRCGLEQLRQESHQRCRQHLLQHLQSVSV